MTTHSEKNPDKLIAEIKLQYGDEPVTIWYDRNKRRYVSKTALNPANTDFYYNRRFDPVGTININTDINEVKKWLEKVKRMNNYDTPIPTSMQNTPMEREE